MVMAVGNIRLARVDLKVAGADLKVERIDGENLIKFCRTELK
jgi:hypothetical protein